MKIDNTSLTFQSSHQSLVRNQSVERLRAWIGDKRPNFEASNLTENPIEKTRISLSAAARVSLLTNINTFSAPRANDVTTSPAASEIEAAFDAVDHDPMLSLIRSMVEMFTGQVVKTLSGKDFNSNYTAPEIPALANPQNHSASSSTATASRAGYGIEYDRDVVREEFERVSFSAQGMIRTQDGQEIRFQLDLQLERQYREESHVSIRAGDAVRKDPIVLNFDGAAAQLTDQYFSFDLNNDGRAELLPMLTKGSGYLAFDRNQNGTIDSGHELFGPATDQGFSELALLDSDDNGWIDEQDAVFDRLGVWTPGQDSPLSSLRDAGVGALGLANIATPFALRGIQNSDLGQLRASGVFLNEDGRAGLLQEIDLSV
jgi:hypothetical protein